MSRELLEYIRRFLDEPLPAGPFTEEYIARWKIERDDGRGVLDPLDLSSVLSSTFCLCDLYNADADRERYEIDEKQLRSCWGSFSTRAKGRESGCELGAALTPLFVSGTQPR